MARDLLLQENLIDLGDAFAEFLSWSREREREKERDYLYSFSILHSIYIVVLTITSTKNTYITVRVWLLL